MSSLIENTIFFLIEERRKFMGRAFELRDIVTSEDTINEEVRTAYRECINVFKQIDTYSYIIFGLDNKTLFYEW